MSNLAIVGSRNFSNLALVKRIVKALKPETVVVSGGARGVDATAESEAQRFISFRPYEMDSIYGYKLYSIETHSDFDIELTQRINPPCFKTWAQAAFARNRWIIDISQGCIAFWDGHSKGTAHSIAIAQSKGIWLRVYAPDATFVQK